MAFWQRCCVLSRLWTSAFVAQQQPGFECDEYVVAVLRLLGHQLEGWPELVRRMYEKLQELDLRAVLSPSRRRLSEHFGILPNTAMETPAGITSSGHTGGPSVLASSRRPDQDYRNSGWILTAQKLSMV